MRVAVYVAIVTGVFGPACSGQSLLDRVNFLSADTGGVRLYGVSAFSGYTTSADPAVGIGGAGIGRSVVYGGSASLGWHYNRQRTAFSMQYNATYSGIARYPELNSLGHSLSFNASRSLTPRLMVNVMGAAQDNTLSESIFQPSQIGILAQMPSTFDDLAAAFAIGRFSNAQMAGMLTGAPLMQFPVRGQYLGNRVLSYSANAGLTFAKSSRLSFHFASFTAGGQHRRRAQAGMANLPVLPRSIGMNAGVGFSYSLSPRTQVGMSLAGSRIDNLYQKGYTTSAIVTVGRKISSRWFASVSAGASTTAMVQSVYGAPPNRQAVGSASLGFRARQHTLLGSYSRSASDPFGIAIGVNTTAAGSWSWHRAGSRWGVFANLGQHQIAQTGFTTLSGWNASGGVSSRLNERTSMTFQYVYYTTLGTFLGSRGEVAVQGLRMTLSWSPQTRH